MAVSAEVLAELLCFQHQHRGLSPINPHCFLLPLVLTWHVSVMLIDCLHEGFKVATALQTRAKRYGGATHGFIQFNSLAEIRCSVRALEDVAIAMRQAVKEDKEPWDLRSYLMVVAVIVAFLAVKVYHFYQTGNAL